MYCTRCGSEVTEEMQWCGGCGGKLPKTGLADSQYDPNRLHRPTAIIAAVLLLVISIIGFCGMDNYDYFPLNFAQSLLTGLTAIMLLRGKKDRVFAALCLLWVVLLAAFVFAVSRYSVVNIVSYFVWMVVWIILAICIFNKRLQNKTVCMLLVLMVLWASVVDMAVQAALFSGKIVYYIIEPWYFKFSIRSIYPTTDFGYIDNYHGNLVMAAFMPYVIMALSFVLPAKKVESKGFLMGLRRKEKPEKRTGLFIPASQRSKKQELPTEDPQVQQLMKLKLLYEQELITLEEYNEKKRRIIDL